MNWYLEALKKYATFSGRARRKEYWMFFLFNIIISTALVILDAIFGSPGMLYALYTLALIIPGLAVSVRRLHDTARSGWWLLLTFVPLIGAIVLFVFLVQDSSPSQNQYGPNPKTT